MIAPVLVETPTPHPQPQYILMRASDVYIGFVESIMMRASYPKMSFVDWSMGYSAVGICSTIILMAYWWLKAKET